MSKERLIDCPHKNCPHKKSSRMFSLIKKKIFNGMTILILSAVAIQIGILRFLAYVEYQDRPKYGIYDDFTGRIADDA